MAQKMVDLAGLQPGYHGFESVREGLGVTISYWADLPAIKNWKANVEHQLAQKLGKDRWYRGYKTRIAKVERDYAM
jgi:heme-degrading monooxygenase HmoA